MLFSGRARFRNLERGWGEIWMTGFGRRRQAHIAGRLVCGFSCGSSYQVQVLRSGSMLVPVFRRRSAFLFHAYLAVVI